jgi:hypothetical protein
MTDHRSSAFKKDLWEMIGMLIRSNHVMIIESANKSKDETMKLQDLEIEISGYDFYLQVQVVKDAPYEMLLGRPFHTLTQATHCHFSNGDSHLMLVNPDTHVVIIILTRARKCLTKQTNFLSSF